MKNQPKICVYAICKNESKFVDRWVNALKEADCIVVMDTGSTDNTVELLQQYSPFVTVEQKIIEPWRFDTARNESMKMIPEDADICVVSDLDQVFRPGWADELRRLYLEGYHEIYGPIIDYDEEGREEKRFLSKNVHPNDKAWYWERPIHEGVNYHGDEEINIITSDAFVIEHHQDKSKSRASYLGLLEQEYAENSTDLLCAIYYSCELYFHGKIDEALEVMFKSLTECDFSGDPSYGYIMYNNIGSLLIEKGENLVALYYLEKSESFGIKSRRLYMTFAKAWSNMKDYKKAIEYIWKALSITEDAQSWIEDSKYFQGVCFDELSMMYYNMEDYIKAAAFARIALTENIEDQERVSANIEFFLTDTLKVYLGESWNDTSLYPTVFQTFIGRSRSLFANKDIAGAYGLLVLSYSLMNRAGDDSRFRGICNINRDLTDYRFELMNTINKISTEEKEEMSPIPEVKENKVCVYAICKNEAQFVDKWIESMKEADLIVVLDTGSTDDTVEKLRAYESNDDVNIKVYQQVITPWRFDVARNVALDYVPEEYNILVSTDLDEILEQGWADILRERWIEGTHIRGNYKYSWSHLSNGESGRIFVYDKIHSREWRWKYPVHELLWSDVSNSENYSSENTLYLFDEIHLHHYPDQTKSRGSYLRLLELRAEENENDYYGLIYLAHEYYYQRQYEKSIATLNKVLTKYSNNYATVEEASCYLFMGDCYFALKENEKAMDSYLKAISIEPTYREPYLDLVKVLLDEKKYVIAQHYISECLTKTYRHYTWLERDLSWTHEPYDLMSLALYYSGKKVESLAYAVKAYEFDPLDERLKNNVNVILENISDQEWANIK